MINKLVIISKITYTQGLPAQPTSWGKSKAVWDGGILNDFGIVVRPTFNLFVWFDGENVKGNGFVTIEVYNFTWKTAGGIYVLTYQISFTDFLPLVAVGRYQDFLLLTGNRRWELIISADGQKHYNTPNAELLDKEVRYYNV